jgi:hypothetical protein
MSSTVWMKPPFGEGEPKEVVATPDVLVPLMTAGWNQCDPPAGNTAAATAEEVSTNVHD